jgi:hypothetical protein
MGGGTGGGTRHLPSPRFLEKKIKIKENKEMYKIIIQMKRI